MFENWNGRERIREESDQKVCHGQVNSEEVERLEFPSLSQGDDDDGDVAQGRDDDWIGD